MSPVRILILAAVFSFCLVPAGCGKRSFHREEVSGTVTFGGRALKWGTISFEPTDEDPLGGSAADITDGEFKIPKDRGPEAGAYRVRIHGGMNPNDNPLVAGPRVDDKLPEGMLPSRFNDNSNMTREIKRGGPNVFTFNLQ